VASPCADGERDVAVWNHAGARGACLFDGRGERKILTSYCRIDVQGEELN
jgi:hypothetical protein